MGVWPLDRWASKISARYGIYDQESGSTIYIDSYHPQVKRIHVAQRENPIVNRLNKTKVEKFPDLAMEKENRQKELRKRDRAAQQARVSCISNLHSLPEFGAIPRCPS
jgi:hypothetical protein